MSVCQLKPDEVTLLPHPCQKLTESYITKILMRVVTEERLKVTEEETIQKLNASFVKATSPPPPIEGPKALKMAKIFFATLSLTNFQTSTENQFEKS